MSSWLPKQSIPTNLVQPTSGHLCVTMKEICCSSDTRIYTQAFHLNFPIENFPVYFGFDWDGSKSQEGVNTWWKQSTHNFLLSQTKPFIAWDPSGNHTDSWVLTDRNAVYILYNNWWKHFVAKFKEATLSEVLSESRIFTICNISNWLISFWSAIQKKATARFTRCCHPHYFCTTVVRVI